MFSIVSRGGGEVYYCDICFCNCPCFKIDDFVKFFNDY